MSPRFAGLILALTVVVATLWLGATGQLVLYIHPRYVVFTMIMAALALVIGIASFAIKPGHDDDAPATRTGRVISVSALALTAVIAVALIVVPPATLTSATVDTREINSTGVGFEVQSVDSASSESDAAFAKFTVRDWASLLAQTSDTAFYSGKPVDVAGFITADETDPTNVFYVSRFVITCCAVDAQPVGVPVYSPNWAESYEVDGWVRVTGSFVANPSSMSEQPIALDPATVELIGTPDEPYLF